MGRIRCGGYEDQIRGTASPLTPALSRQGRGSYKTRDGTATNASTSPIPSLQRRGIRSLGRHGGLPLQRMPLTLALSRQRRWFYCGNDRKKNFVADWFSYFYKKTKCLAIFIKF